MKNKIIKIDLMDNVYQNAEIKKHGLSRKEVENVISKFVDKLKESILNLDSGDRIELRKFGTFGVKQRKARVARNPKTGKEVKVPERKSVFFKPGREMKQTIMSRN